MNMDYKNLLYEKAQREFNEYRDQLMQMPQDRVFNHSYETAVKQDLLCIFENEEFTQMEAKALCKLTHPLEACYQEWLSNDMSNMENLRSTVDNRVKSAVKEEKKNEKEIR